MAEFVTRYKRYAQITTVFAKHDFGYLFDYLGLRKLFGGTDLPEEPKASEESAMLTVPERLRMAFEELGPTFVKMGQIISTRPDLIPRPYIVEFRKLQDNVKPLPFDTIKEVIEEELGTPLEESFASFDEEPLAAASIGQVHRCKLKDGQEAVAKVQRPHIEEQIRMDLTILYAVARLANRSALAESIDMVKIIAEFERVILRELDFTSEGRLTEEFARTYADDPEVQIAKIYWDVSSRRLLTMEYLEGINISDIEALKAEGVDTRALAKKISMLTLRQIFLDGLFHADPHPGNLMALPGGVLGIIDFGMTGRFDKYTLLMLKDLMLDILAQDHVSMAAHLLDHDLIGYDVDMRQLRNDLRSFFRNISSMPMAQASEALQNFIVTYKLRIQPDLFFLDKTFGTLDGTIRLLAPNFNLKEVADEFGLEFGKRTMDIEVLGKQIALRLLKDADAIVEMPILLRRLLRRLDAGFLSFSNSVNFSDQGYARLNRLGLRVFGTLTGLSSFAFAWLLRESTWLLPGAISLRTFLTSLGIALLLLTGWGLWRDSRE